MAATVCALASPAAAHPPYSAAGLAFRPASVPLHALFFRIQNPITDVVQMAVTLTQPGTGAIVVNDILDGEDNDVSGEGDPDPLKFSPDFHARSGDGLRFRVEGFQLGQTVTATGAYGDYRLVLTADVGLWRAGQGTERSRRDTLPSTSLLRPGQASSGARRGVGHHEIAASCRHSRPRRPRRRPPGRRP